MSKTFKEIVKSKDKNERLLKRFADAVGSILYVTRTPDGWDIEAKVKNYFSIGPTYPEVYDELVSYIMASNGWSTVEEMEVWLDLNEVNNR